LKYMLRMRWMFKVSGLARGRGYKGRKGRERERGTFSRGWRSIIGVNKSHDGVYIRLKKSQRGLFVRLDFSHIYVIQSRYNFKRCIK
jgi:hypothetical protein